MTRVVIGKKRYPEATSILILADGGGSNSSKPRIQTKPTANCAWRTIHRTPLNGTQLSMNSCLGRSGVEHHALAKGTKNTKTKTGLKVFARVTKLQGNSK